MSALEGYRVSALAGERVGALTGYRGGALVVLFVLLLSAGALGQTGSLTVQTAPGTEITWEGISLGVADSEGKLEISEIPPGQYTLKLVKVGFKSRELQVEISGGPQLLELQLESAVPPRSQTAKRSGTSAEPASGGREAPDKAAATGWKSPEVGNRAASEASSRAQRSQPDEKPVPATSPPTPQASGPAPGPTPQASGREASGPEASGREVEAFGLGFLAVLALLAAAGFSIYRFWNHSSEIPTEDPPFADPPPRIHTQSISPPSVSDSEFLRELRDEETTSEGQDSDSKHPRPIIEIDAEISE